KRVPSLSVAHDEFTKLGVSRSDASTAYRVFTRNLESTGLIRPAQNGGRVISIDEAIEGLANGTPLINQSTASLPEGVATHTVVDSVPSSPPYEEPHRQERERGRTQISPSVHVNVQIHIDASA